MVTQIKNSKDVSKFTKQIINEGVSFHPEDDFKDYVISKTNKPCYTKKQAEARNKLMNQCFTVCEKNGVDIYDTMSEVALKDTGLNKFIFLPSAKYIG